MMYAGQIEHEQRGRVTDRVVDEMKVIIQEAVMPAGQVLERSSHASGLSLSRRARLTLC